MYSSAHGVLYFLILVVVGCAYLCANTLVAEAIAVGIF